jgi:hypothetical protein
MKTDGLGRPINKHQQRNLAAIMQCIAQGRPYTPLGNYFTHLPLGRTKQQALQRGEV